MYDAVRKLPVENRILVQSAIGRLREGTVWWQLEHQMEQARKFHIFKAKVMFNEAADSVNNTKSISYTLGI